LVYGPYDVRVVNVNEPKVTSPDDVVVKIMACGVCPFDVRIYSGGFKRTYPIPIGHEVSGIVADVGENVKNVKVNDKVAIDAMIRCDTCRYCRSGINNLCENKDPLPNGFAEYMKIPAKYVHKITTNTISFEEAALAEPLACIINGLEKASVKLGDIVHIVGAGPIGLMFIKLCKLMGCKVIVSEVIDERLQYAKRVGADFAVNVKVENVVERVLEYTEGYGVNSTILTVTNQEVLNLALETTDKGGSILIFAVASNPNLTVNVNTIHYKELKIVGSVK